MEFNKRERTLIAVSTMIIIFSGALLANAMYLRTHSSYNIVIDALQKDIKNIRTILQVDVYDTCGNLKESRLKDDDLILNNFGSWMSGLLYGQALSKTASLKDTGGGTYGLNVKGTSAWVITTNNNLGGMIGIGTGTTAPTVGDYELEAQQEGWTAVVDPTYADGNITFGASIQLSSAQDITEAGVIYDGGNWNFLLIRDTFTAIPVGEGESVAVTYTIILGTGFTDNWGYILGYHFDYVLEDASGDTFSLTDSAGNSRTARVHIATGSMGSVVTPPSVPNVIMAIGTGTTAPDLTDYDLETQVESSFACMNPSWNLGDGGNVTLGGMVSVSASREITEAGVYMVIKDTGTASRTILIWRTTFTAESLESGEFCVVTFGMYS